MPDKEIEEYLPSIESEFHHVAHVEFINRLSWAELRDHLTSDGGHALDENLIDRPFDVVSRRKRAEITHRELHAHGD